MIKALLFDFSRVVLNPKEQSYTGSLNELYTKLSQNEPFDSRDYFTFNQELLDFVEQLKGKYQLYLFTTGKIQEDRHLISVIESIWKRIFTKGSIGFAKNDEKAYFAIAKKLSLHPQEILFIDDSEENVAAAKKAGVRTILFISTKQTINDLRAFL